MPKNNAEQIAALTATLDELERQLATEVRTRRLVVVAEDGFERVIADDVSEKGLAVRARSQRGDSTSVGLVVGDGEETDGHEWAGLMIWGGDNALVGLDATHREPGATKDTCGFTPRRRTTA